MIFSSPISRHLSLHARHTLKEARDIALYTKSSSIESRHLLLALALENGSLGSILLENVGLKKDTLGKSCLKKNTRSLQKKKNGLSLPLSPEIQEVIKRAFFIASENGYPYVGTEHLMGALLLSEDAFVQNLLQEFEIDQEKIHTLIESHLHFEQFPQIARMFEMSDTSATENQDGSTTPLLDQYTVDLKREAEKSPTPVIGRERELERLMQILGRKEKRNALLIGEPGVGKTALVTALATRIQSGKVGSLLHEKSIRSLDLALLVAGTSFRGEFENRLKELLKEVKNHGKIILFIDEIHTLVGTGNTQGGLDAANILKPALARGEFQCIGATTLSEYKRHLEKDAALDRRFQTILIKEPTLSEAQAIVSAAAPYYTAYHRVVFPQPILEETVTLSERFIPERFLPDKALDLIDEAGALVRSRHEYRKAPSLLHSLEQKVSSLEKRKINLIEEGSYDQALALEKKLQTLQRTTVKTLEKTLGNNAHESNLPEVTHDDLITVLANITRIPKEQLGHEVPAAKVKRLEKTLQQLFIGQSEVQAAVLRVITRSLSPIRDPRKPLGSFFLMGPTGVGKTYLAQMLAREFLGDEQSLIRLDMSEFMERHSTAQLLGAPAGYIGYGDGGKLTEAVRRRPYSIILFDEIEKAHPDVANLLLQILDEGVLTDAEGRQVSFRNTLIFITSNIGTESFNQAAKIGFTSTSHQARDLAFEAIRNNVLKELKEVMRPELIARLDEVLVFEPLSGSSLKKIARQELSTLQKCLLTQGIHLTIRPIVLDHLVKIALERKQGARSIKKIIRDTIEFIIAQILMKSPISQKITLTLQHGTISIEK